MEVYQEVKLPSKEGIVIHKVGSAKKLNQYSNMNYMMHRCRYYYQQLLLEILALGSRRTSPT